MRFKDTCKIGRGDLEICASRNGKVVQCVNREIDSSDCAYGFAYWGVQLFARNIMVERVDILFSNASQTALCRVLGGATVSDPSVRPSF